MTAELCMGRKEIDATKRDFRLGRFPFSVRKGTEDSHE